MAWDFETDPDFAEQLAWIDTFVREEVEPLDLILQSPFDVDNPLNRRFVRPLQERVKDRGLWACHLGPELGGPGYGQVKLALMNEILGRSVFAPTVFGCQAPDSGNAEILAVYGTEDQKARYLKPLLANDIVSCFSMTEPQGGADPTTFSARAVLKGDQWVLNGEKWFATNARYASFFLVMAVTDPDAPPHRRLSVFIIPKGTPGLEIVRNVGYGDRDPSHAYLRFTDVGVPVDHMLGGQGDGFVVAQVRLGGGRIHHAMRTIGKARQAFDMLCDRALSRVTRNEPLANKQMVQEKIADSWIELEQFRLLVLRTAWKIDREKDYNKVRGDISAVKAAMPKVLHDIAARAVYVHGSLGLSNETPLAAMVLDSFQIGLADGPTDIHKVTLAKQLLRGRKHSLGLFPDYHLPARREAALAKHGLSGDEAGLKAAIA
jgi:acyl-CoA dehydrogenase